MEVEDETGMVADLVAAAGRSDDDRRDAHFHFLDGDGLGYLHLP